MAGMGKVKALQIWCRNRVNGYRDVEITNMTTSWRSGLAFCALIHKFRPDLIDYESLSKENVLENNALAFDVGENLGIPALLDAEDMVRLETPDKLSIITYVAQMHNYFKDHEPVGGPGIQTAPKRHSTPVSRSVTMREPESKRKPTPVLTKNTSPAAGQVSPSADICVACDGKVYLIEKHMADGKLYHRSCFRRNNRKSDTSALSSPASKVVETPKKSDIPPARPGLELGLSGLTGLRKPRPASSLPATPTTAEDTRPEWQRRIQDKSAVSAVRKSVFKAGLEPLSESDTGSNKSTPGGGASPARGASPVTAAGRKLTELPKTEADRVVLRSRTPPVTGQDRQMPRAVSVGVNLDEKLNKLRQLRESGKASAAAKARLERLKAATSAGREAISGSKENISSSNSEKESSPPPTETAKPEASVVESEASVVEPEPTKVSLKEEKADAKQNGAMDVDITSTTEIIDKKTETTVDTSTHPSTPVADPTPKQLPVVEEVKVALEPAKVDSVAKTEAVAESADVESDGSEAMSITENMVETSSADEAEKATELGDGEVKTPPTVVEDKPSTKTDDEIVAKKERKNPFNPFEETESENIPEETEDNSNTNNVSVDKPIKPKSPIKSSRPLADGDKQGSTSSQESGINKAVESRALSRDIIRKESKTDAKSDSSTDKAVAAAASSPLSQATSKASISLTSTPSAPVRAKRAQSAQSVNSVTRPSPNTTPTAPSLRLDTASKSRRPSDLPATDSVSSARRRPLSAMNITVSASPSSSINRRSSGASLSNLPTPTTPTTPAEAKAFLGFLLGGKSSPVQEKVAMFSNAPTKSPPKSPPVYSAKRLIRSESAAVEAKPDNNNTQGPLNTEREAHKVEKAALKIKLSSGSADEESVSEFEEPKLVRTEDTMPFVSAARGQTSSAVTADTHEDFDNISAKPTKVITSADIPMDIKPTQNPDTQTEAHDFASESSMLVDGSTPESNIVLKEVESVSESDAPNRSPSPPPQPSSVSPSCMPITCREEDQAINPPITAAVTTPSPNENQRLQRSDDNITDEESERKSPRPTRPSASPAVTKKQQPDSKKEAPAASRSDRVLTRPSPPRDTVQMRNKQNSDKAPPRPNTVATGTPAKSQFYMDQSHKTVTEPPPKPARQSVIQQTVSKAKDGWEDALENWSIKRKEESARSTWYSTESYPTEHNPFGDDDNDETIVNKPTDPKSNSNHNNSDLPVATTVKTPENYDDNLNPFADDVIVEDNTHNAPVQPVNITNGNVAEQPKQKKVIHFNPFEVSDSEEEAEASHRTKLTVHEQVKSADVLKKTPSIRHKKKKAPTPPAPTIDTKSLQPPTESQSIKPAMDTTTPVIDTKLSSQPNHNNDESLSESMNNSVNSDESKFNELNSSDTKSPESAKKRNKPAPPRPMPPKRRVQSDLGVTPDDIARELELIDAKQIELEEKGRTLEQAIRNADHMSMGSEDSNTSASVDEDALLSSWLETINEKNHLVRRESELVFIAKHHELEGKQADIEWELRHIMNKAEALKTPEDKTKEEDLLQQLVTVVHERSKLVDKMDDERQRQQEEDVEINAVMSAKFDSSAQQGSSKTPEKKSSKNADKKKDKRKDKKDKKKVK